MIQTYQFGIKTRKGRLNYLSRKVNFVWNYCNDIQKQALQKGRKWPSGFDFNNLTVGTSKEIDIHSGTVNAVCEQYAKSRSQKQKPYLRYRGQKTLGWVPFKGRDLKFRNGCFEFNKCIFKVFLTREIPCKAKFKDSSFSKDRKGNWHLNVVLDIPEKPKRKVKSAVGIDLGLKDFAVLSSGKVIENPRHFRKLEDTLGKAQRARKKNQITNLHFKIRNQRKDFQHKLSHKLVRDFDLIAVGNVNASALGKTNLAKSVYDVGWSAFRNMLAYKSVREGATFFEVDEKYTTQTCAVCGSIAGPKGRAGLNKREWDCDCGSHNVRDHNSAVLILLRSGHRTPAQGIPFF
jgi:putative transposase